MARIVISRVGRVILLWRRGMVMVFRLLCRSNGRRTADKEATSRQAAAG
jgi:hypothetical protein